MFCQAQALLGVWALCTHGVHIRLGDCGPQRTQYPLIKEYALNFRGLNIMKGVLGSLHIRLGDGGPGMLGDWMSDSWVNLLRSRCLRNAASWYRHNPTAQPRFRVSGPRAQHR